MHPRSARAALVALSFALHLPLSAQGPLNPAGAPAASMKSLAQVEPRIDLATLAGDASCVYLISQPGSYYLSAKVAGVSGRGGIVIDSPNVTLDLNGFAISGVPGSTIGLEVRAGATANVTVRGGSIAGWDQDGVRLPATLANGLFEDLSVSSCNSGIVSFGYANRVTVRRCRLHDLKADGIMLNGGGTIVECTVSQISGAGIMRGLWGNRVQRCSVDDLASTGIGAAGIYGEIVQQCLVNSISSAGATTGIGGTNISDCEVNYVSGGGTSSVTGVNGTTVSRCHANQIGASGGGSPTGIGGNVVSHCTVFSVGNASSGGPVAGIVAGAISHCTVSSIGNASVNQAVSGIAGQYDGVISDCTVTYIGCGQAALRGISGRQVSRSRVNNLTQANANSQPGGYAAGIEAESIVDCTVTLVSGKNSDGTRGLSAFRLAAGCEVSSITDTTSTARALDSSTGAVVERCTIYNVRLGMRVGGPGTRISGSLFNDITASGSGTGCGLGIYTTNVRIENCTFTSNATAGVYVNNGTAIVDSCNFGLGPTAVLLESGALATVTRNRVGVEVSTVVSGPGAANAQIGSSVTGGGAISSTSAWVNFRN